MKTLKELNEELDAFNATLNDENEDTPELLAEQERLLNAIIAAEAADLTALSAKALSPTSISERRASIWRKAYPRPRSSPRSRPFRRSPRPSRRPTAHTRCRARGPSFSAAAYAAAHGLEARELRKKLRAAGLKAPYSLADVEKVLK